MTTRDQDLEAEGTKTLFFNHTLKQAPEEGAVPIGFPFLAPLSYSIKEAIFSNCQNPPNLKPKQKCNDYQG